MKFTEQGIEATHQEVVDWLQWRAQQMLASGIAPEAVRTWGALTSVWLSTGGLYLQKDSADKCEVCEGTGRSKLVIGLGSSTACTACKGTGIKTEGRNG